MLRQLCGQYFAQSPQCLHTIGKLSSLAKWMAFTTQASAHFLHLIHFFPLWITPPPLLSDSAPVGQAMAQARSPLQAKQCIAKNLLVKPPTERTLMALSASE